MKTGDFGGGAERVGKQIKRKNNMELGKPLYLNMCSKVLFILLKDNYKL